MKLLIVDDSVAFLKALKAILSEADYSNIVMKESAGAAIEYLKAESSNGKRVPVDIILMDVLMPDMDGIEAVRKIKSVEALKDIPIIMISAQEAEERIEHSFDAGAVDYVSKPIKKLELRARIRSILKLKEEMARRKQNEKKLEVLNKRLESSNKELQKLSVTDGLTNIANRRYFDDILSKEWRRAVRTKTVLSLLMVDIDWFKPYNDHYGHLKGDEALRKVARALKRAIRRSGDLLARYGGEEFVALLPGTDIEGTVRVANAMQQEVQRLGIEHVASGTVPVITTSIGMASTMPVKEVLPTALVEQADLAMYQAKQQGRNRIVSADS